LFNKVARFDPKTFRILRVAKQACVELMAEPRRLPLGIAPRRLLRGRDRYEGAPAAQQQFNPGVQFFHSSQGFGCDGGVGVLRDTGNGRDTYLFGPAGGQNGASITQAETTCQPAAPGISSFSDDG